ncbi:hypothetical protein [Neisseria animaloris]|uniref:Uncharacterized protein n=1 Tax=Neisseria animaloris TaxID=326522 RepID=A0A3S5F6G5_9NEIS|nr:hypothetical protein [Neisseria animaloris]VEJ20877.1 Uncharacterised protein [Neisseria animaloris]
MQDFEKIITIFAGGGIWIILLATLWILFIYIHKIENLYDFFILKQIKLLRENIDDNNLEEGIRNILKEKLNSIFFKKSFGIYANAKLRNNIYPLIENTNINVADIKKSKRYIKTDNNFLSVVITPKDETKYKRYQPLVVLCMIAFTAYLIIPTLIFLGLIKQNPENLSPQSITDDKVIIICLVAAFMYLGFAYFFRKRAIGYETAQKLQQTLLKLNQN